MVCSGAVSVPSATMLRAVPTGASLSGRTLMPRKGFYWTTCQDKCPSVLKFENGVWPFPTSRTPPGEQTELAWGADRSTYLLSTSFLNRGVMHVVLVQREVLPRILYL